MPAAIRKQTRGDVVYERLRSAILGGHRSPGERLKFPELADQFDVSVSVLREALTRLTTEGLVTCQPRQGYAVTDLSREQLEELTEARVALETLVFAKSVTDGDLDWESNVVAAHHRMSSTQYLDEDSQISEAWARAHAEFHRALLSGCRNERLLGIANRLRDEAELYRLWSHNLGSDTGRDLVAEHQALLDAAVARDVDAATAALDHHISLTTELLLASEINTTS